MIAGLALTYSLWQVSRSGCWSWTPRWLSYPGLTNLTNLTSSTGRGGARPLLHLLPKRVLEMLGLPLLRGGQWPFLADYAGIDDFLLPDFEVRLARARHGQYGHI